MLERLRRGTSTGHLYWPLPAGPALTPFPPGFPSAFDTLPLTSFVRSADSTRDSGSRRNPSARVRQADDPNAQSSVNSAALETGSGQTALSPCGTLLSVNVGMPKDVPWRGKTVFTGVYKAPVGGRRRVDRLNVEGDGQGDLAGHGGEQRAVFVYQLDSYRYWERELGRDDFVHGQFGENFTVEGLGDDEVCIGDRYRIGTAVFEVTQPRVTCYRVGIRMNDPRIPALARLAPPPGVLLPRAPRRARFKRGTMSLKVAAGPGADDRRGGRRAPLPARAPTPATPPRAPDPGPQPRLADVVPGSARRSSPAAERRPDCRGPATGLARLSPPERQRDRPRERLRDLYPSRRSRRRTPPCSTRRAVRDGTHPARARCKGPCSATTPCPARPMPATTALASSGNTTVPCQRLSPHPPPGRRPARRRRAARHLHARSNPGTRAADHCRHRRSLPLSPCSTRSR